MSPIQKVLFYFIPLFCLLFLGLALWQSQRGGHSSGLSLSPLVLSVYCDQQLEDATEAILAAYQRRSQVQVELTSVAPEAWVDQTKRLAPGALLLSMEKLQERGLQTHPQTLAWSVPVLAVRPELANNLRSWQDFCGADLRLATPSAPDSALGRSVASILREHRLEWKNIINKIVYQSSDGDYLVRSIALEKADAAIVWEANARHYSSLVKTLTFPGNEKYAAELSLYYLPPTEVTSAAQRQLIDFMTGSLAAELWRDFGYQQFCGDDCY